MTTHEPVSDEIFDQRARVILDRHEAYASEADIRAAIHSFLIETRLAEEDDIELESAAGSGRMDLRSSDLAIEVKRRIGERLNARQENKDQLDEYLATLEREGQPSRLGILTDGKYWLIRRPGADWNISRPYSFVLESAEQGIPLYEWLRDESQAIEGRNIIPSEEEVKNRLGPGPRFDRAFDDLRALYDPHREEPTVIVKRDLWHDMLAAALGIAFAEETDIDDLFLRHTYLSAVVGMAVQSAFDIDIEREAALNPERLLRGDAFVDATSVRGVIESDFFTWPVEVGGDEWIRGIARRVARFDWVRADADIASYLYETVIPPAERKRLGEYYTPDWLARAIVDHIVADPINQRVLDPACGSGTFLFWAIRRFVDAARTAGQSPGDILRNLLTHVVGIDVHPVAVHLARATWTFGAREAINESRNAAEAVDITVPVYLGDSLQLQADMLPMFGADSVLIRAPVTEDEDGLLRFPRSLVQEPERFDGLMARISEELRQGHDGQLALHDAGITDPAEVATLTETLAVLHKFHQLGRDHIWAYFARNHVRPAELETRPVDVIVGNPPWLTHGMAAPDIADHLKSLSQRYDIWVGTPAYAGRQNLASLFYARVVDLYLREGGTIGMVLPHTALQSGQFRKWRSGDWDSARVAFDAAQPWDLAAIEPNTFFPVPSCVVFAKRIGPDQMPRALPESADRWRGEPGGDYDDFEHEGIPLYDTSGDYQSPYAGRARAGAVFMPRRLVLVDEIQQSGPLAAAGTMTVSPRVSGRDKNPWKSLDLADMEERPVERGHLFQVHAGTTVVPYGLLEPETAFVPISEESGMIHRTENGDLFGIDPQSVGPLARERWRAANRHFDQHKPANKDLTLLGQLDFIGQLSAQIPAAKRPRYRVVYGQSGEPTAAIVRDRDCLIDYTLFWIGCKSLAEAHYLIAILNSRTLLDAVRPLATMGWGDSPHHVQKHIWRLPIPEFDAHDPRHLELSELGKAVEPLARQVVRGLLGVRGSSSTGVDALRRELRAWRDDSPEAQKVEERVSSLLA